MPENAVSDYRSTCTSLASAMQDITVKVKVSEQNQKLRDTYNEQLQKHNINIGLCTSVMDELKPLIADTEEYINRRRTESMQNINNALRMSGEIIPDSDDGICIKLDGDEAWVSTSDNRTVQNTEGGAFRQISASFLQAVMLGANQNLLQTMMLDEMFSQVNAENTAKLSLYLSVLSQNMQIICIEQKPEIKSNVDTLVYLFKKGEKFAEVSKSFVKAGADINEAVKENTENGS